MASSSVAVFVCLCVATLSAPPPPLVKNKEDLKLATEFMSRFGYLESQDSSETESLIKLEQAVKDVQRFGGLPQTGKLDNSTLQLMKSPRCGLPDLIPSKAKRRRRVGNSNKRPFKRNKRYILSSSLGWRKRLLTYYIANWSPKIGHSSVRTEMQRALNAWAKYGKLKFREVTSPDADIVVAFGSGYHGDPYPFDGPGSTLAHAFFPGEDASLGGDIHFDDDEQWKINPGEFEDGVDFFTVAVHEVGHSLGLSHSPEIGSVMNPYYKLFDSKTFSLDYDDIMAMYELYITKFEEEGNETWDENRSDEDSKRRKSTTTTTRKPTPPPTPQTTTRRTTVTTPRETPTKGPYVTYVGDDESVEVHKTHDTKHGIPDPMGPQTPLPTVRPQTHSPTARPHTAATPTRPFTTPSPSEPNAPDACDGNFDAVSFLRGELFIFKGNYVWRLSGPGRIASGYPVTIHRMFHSLPQAISRIDAAYERDSDSNLIFFSGDRYWVYNGNEFVDGSPRSIHDYGLPGHTTKIDAVMVWGKNRKTYLFSGEKFWRFNETLHKMDSGYPKHLHLFRGVPSGLDSAMTWSDGVTYFFKNNLYWAFNNTWLKTEPFYPQEASKYWLGCR